jgi:hypothetical protein
MNVTEKEPDNAPEMEITQEPLLKPTFTKGRPKKTDEEKAVTRRANLDRRNERAKTRREAERVLKETNGKPIVADFSATKNNRVDGVINPSLDPLYEQKMQYERKLLDKKYMIEDARLDMYLKSMSSQQMQPAAEPKAKKERKPREPKPKPTPIAVPKKQDISVADQIFNLYK